MAKYRQKRYDDVPGQEVVPQVERYLGSDVLGMEETTARPMSFETGADPAVRMPGRPRSWMSEKTMQTKSTTNGKVPPPGPINVIGFGILHVEKK